MAHSLQSMPYAEVVTVPAMHRPPYTYVPDTEVSEMFSCYGCS